MNNSQMITVDGNEAAASVAYRMNEVVVIYPITPSSPMAEFCDEWSAQGKRNLWGDIPQVVEMQSEGGAADRSADADVRFDAAQGYFRLAEVVGTRTGGGSAAKAGNWPSTPPKLVPNGL